MGRTIVATFVFLAGSLVARSAPQSNPSDSTIVFGDFVLTLGANQDETLDKLAAVFDLKNANGNWLIAQKGGPPFAFLGVVAFRNQKLTYASKSWGPDIQSAAALAHALHNAVSAAYGSQRGGCDVSTATMGTDAVETVIQCGRHRLDIYGALNAETRSTINESIRLP